jgi:hypothetical protein
MKVAIRLFSTFVAKERHWLSLDDDSCPNLPRIKRNI